MKIKRIVLLMVILNILILGGVPTSSAIPYEEDKITEFNTSDTFSRPMAVLKENNQFYVVDRLNDRIVILDDDWNYVDEFDGSDSSSSFTNPEDIASNGTNLFVVDQDRLVMFDLNGAFVAESSSVLGGDLVAVEYYNNHIYASDQGNSRIQEFDKSLTLDLGGDIGVGTTSEDLISPYGFDINNGIVYVADDDDNKIKMYSLLEEEFVGYFGNNETHSLILDQPYGVTVQNDRIFVTDLAEYVIVYDLAGNVLDTVNYDWNNPRHIEFTNTQLIIPNSVMNEIIVLKLVATPSQVTAKVHDRDVAISWDIDTSQGISDPKTYNVYRNTSSGYEYLGFTNEGYFVDVTAKHNTSYKYRVQAESQIGVSEFSSSNVVPIEPLETVTETETEVNNSTETVTVTETNSSGDSDTDDEGGSFIDNVPISPVPILGTLLLVPILRKIKN